MMKSIIAALAVLTGMAPQANDYAAAAARVRVTDLPPITIPDPPLPQGEKPDPEKEKEKAKAKEKEKQEQQKWHAHFKQLASDRQFWQDAFRKIDQKLGLFTDQVSIEIALQPGPMIAVTRSSYTPSNRSGHIFSNTTSMKGQDDRMIQAMLTVHGTKIVVEHYFHARGLVANKKASLPNWFTEGLAGFVGYGDWPMANRKLRVQKISMSLKSEEAAMRGRLFFDYIESQGGDTLKRWIEATVLEGRDLPEACQAVFQTDWNKFLDAEKKWSEQRISK